MATFGNFFSGLAAGAQQGIALTQQHEDRAIKRAQLENAQAKSQRDQMMKATKEIGAMMDKALMIPDERERKTALGNIAQAADVLAGEKGFLPKEFLEYATRNPEAVRTMVGQAQSNGIQLPEIIQAIKNPLMRARAQIAWAESQREQEIRGLAAGGEGAGAVTTPLPAAQPIEGQAIPPGGVTAPTPGLEGLSKDLEKRIAALTERINGVRARGASAQLVNSLVAERKELSDNLFDLRAKPNLAIAAEGRQPINKDEAQAIVDQLVRGGHRDLARRVRTGMPRAAADALIGAAAAKGVPQVTHSPLAAPQPGVPTRFNASGDVLSTDEQSLLKIEREFDDAKRRKLMEGYTKLGMKRLESYQELGEAAKELKTQLSLMSAGALRVGPMGTWITPIRQQVNAFAQLIGVSNPTSMAPMALVDAMTNRMATLMTSQMKGQQSDKELFLAIMSQPGLRQSQQGLAVMVYAFDELASRNIARAQEARVWTDRYGDINARNKNGKTFQEVFDLNIQALAKKHGTLGDRIGKAFNIDPEALLKGVIKASP